jgi:hypothetical protein
MKNIPFEQSFASHPKSVFWSEINDTKPEFVSLNSHKKYWFDCECGHSFESNLLNINHGNNWCPYCYNRKLCGNCETCYNKSFASHEKSKYWSNKNNCDPLTILKGSDKKFYFNCNNCNHEFIISPKKNNLKKSMVLLLCSFKVM